MLPAAALAALALAAGSLEPELSAAAGAGYDSNLSHDPSSSLAVGAGYAATRAAAGASLDVGATTNLHGGLHLLGEAYPDYSDLSTWSAGVGAALLQELSEPFALVLSPLAAWSWSGDRARDATLLAAALTLRARLLDQLTLRVSYGHTRRDASDPAFSYDRDRVGGSAEWRLAPRTYLALGYAVELGQEVFYRATAGAGGGMGGHVMGTFGRSQEAYRAGATSHTVGPSLELGLGGGFFLEARYAWRLVRSAAGDYQSHVAQAGLGWRL